MLVLQRKQNERIVIGGGIVITIVEIRIDEHGCRKVRVGIDAPDDVPVYREEVFQAIQRGEPPRRDGRALPPPAKPGTDRKG